MKTLPAAALFLLAGLGTHTLGLQSMLMISPVFLFILYWLQQRKIPPATKPANQALLDQVLVLRHTIKVAHDSKQRQVKRKTDWMWDMRRNRYYSSLQMSPDALANSELMDVSHQLELESLQAELLRLENAMQLAEHLYNDTQHFLLQWTEAKKTESKNGSWSGNRLSSIEAELYNCAQRAEDLRYDVGTLLV
jgi:hypothetical protein